MADVQQAPAAFDGLSFPDGQDDVILVWGDSSVFGPKGRTDWSQTNYENAVVQVLSNIYRSQVGKALIDHLARQDRLVMIMPCTTGDPRTTAMDIHAAFPAGVRERLCTSTGYRHVGARRLLARYTGTGRGSPAAILFTPGAYVGKTSAGERQDEVLLHELVHAIRITTGTQTCRPWGHQMHSVDEVIAITLTNLYSSTLNPPRPLRKDHTGYSAVQGSPEDWIDHMKPALQEFARRNQLLVYHLQRASLQSGFQPFRGSILGSMQL